MKEQEFLKEETEYFFKNILYSKEMQDEYDLTNYINRDNVLYIIKNFIEDSNFYIVKPFYENDYMDKSVPRTLIVFIENNLIYAKIINEKIEQYPIDTKRFVCIIKESIEDESIKMQMNQEKQNRNENEFEK